MTSKAKKRVVLPTRPEPPTIEQILEDIQDALPSDPVFFSLEELTEGSLLPSVSGREEECRIESNQEQQYQQSRSYVAMNQRLQEIQGLLKTTCDQLKQAGESLESNIAEIRERAL